jgi:transposase InsO family protein
MEILYRPGKQNVRADALSRREQDLPGDAEDERLQKRLVQVLKPTSLCYEEASQDEEDLAGTWVMSAKVHVGRMTTGSRAIGEQSKSQDIAVTTNSTEQAAQEVDAPKEQTEQIISATPQESPAPAHELEKLWLEALENDRQHQNLTQAVVSQERRFPPSLGVKCSISECSIDDRGQLLYRGRRWVPDNENLRTRIISETHDSLLTGHPGREITYRMVARDFFWPGMSDSIRRYVRNCDVCGRTKPWREGAQGLLKPLPVPDRLWKEISIDFIEGLPGSEGMTCLMVVTDRLSKGSIFIPLPDTKTETVVQAFIRYVVAYHWLPDAITSDRGSQFVSLLWERLCEILKIKRRLSTAFHPQTDGSTERMNSVLEAYIRAFVNWAQDNWALLCPMAQIAINGRDATSTGVAPFFLQHGYNVDPLQLELPSGADYRKFTAEQRSDRERAEAIAAKFRDVFDLVQASMAEAQQEQERQANKNRKEARNYRVGDKVWLRIDKQYSTGRQSRKLDWKNAKYTVLEVIDSHSVKLDTPPGHHPVFHVDRLRLASTDPLPSQVQDDYQPLPLRVNEVDEWVVEDIVGEQLKRRGRGWKLYYDVKWKGYHQTSLEPAELLADTEALDRWEAYTRDHRDKRNCLPEGFRTPTLFKRREEGGIVMG